MSKPEDEQEFDTAFAVASFYAQTAYDVEVFKRPTFTGNGIGIRRRRGYWIIWAPGDLIEDIPRNLDAAAGMAGLDRREPA